MTYMASNNAPCEYEKYTFKVRIIPDSSWLKDSKTQKSFLQKVPFFLDFNFLTGLLILALHFRLRKKEWFEEMEKNGYENYFFKSDDLLKNYLH